MPEEEDLFFKHHWIDEVPKISVDDGKNKTALQYFKIISNLFYFNIYIRDCAIIIRRGGGLKN